VAKTLNFAAKQNPSEFLFLNSLAWNFTPSPNYDFPIGVKRRNHALPTMTSTSTMTSVGKPTKEKGQQDFFWTYTEEPHRTRRQAIIKAHPEVKSLLGYCQVVS
jgi:hypothetical protein